MKIPIPPEPLDKVFALVTPYHFLMKLNWEVEGLRKAERDSEDLAPHLTAAYHAFNCAVTAWHMVDWIWESLEPSDRAEVATSLGMTVANAGLFRRKMRSSSRAINCCRDIATGSKHKVVSEGADPKVRAVLEWKATPAQAGSMKAGDPLVRYRATLMIHDEGGARPALEVFEEALEFWHRLLEQWGFAEARFIEGSARE